MTHMYRRHLAALMVSSMVAVAALAGCGARDSAVQAPPGMKVGPSLTDAQIKALDQKKAARGQQPAPAH